MVAHTHQNRSNERFYGFKILTNSVVGTRAATCFIKCAWSGEQILWNIHGSREKLSNQLLSQSPGLFSRFVEAWYEYVSLLLNKIPTRKIKYYNMKIKNDQVNTVQNGKPKFRTKQMRRARHILRSVFLFCCMTSHV